MNREQGDPACAVATMNDGANEVTSLDEGILPHYHVGGDWPSASEFLR